MTKGTKMPPKVGSGGRLFYNYGIGLRVWMQEGNERWEFEIEDCTYLNGTEYYTCMRNCALMPAQLSANRIRFLLSVYGQEVISEGAHKELPLLSEEVENFYAELQENYAKQVFKMEKCAEYTTVRRKINALAFKIGTYEALEKPGVEDLKEELSQLKAQANEALIKNGIDVAVIEKEPCPHCLDKGFDGVGICDCAYVRAEEIKIFNAKIRVKARKYQNLGRKKNYEI